MIIWGGETNNSLLNSGGRYDPATDTLDIYKHLWRAALLDRGTRRYGREPKWLSGAVRMKLSLALTPAANTTPAPNSWTPTSTTNAPDWSK